MDQQTLEGDFYEYFQSVEGINTAWNRTVLTYYLDFFTPDQRVLDVGCGQGQFIELLGEVGIAAQGVDVDTRMVELCCSKGLSVVESDLFAYLADPSAQFGGIFSSNVIEHLNAPDALRFMHLAYAALQPGGVLVVATPNPESLIVHLYEFWRDATHVRLYSAALLEFMLYTAGFRSVVTGGNPRTTWDPGPEFSRLSELWAQKEAPAVQSHPWQTILEAAAPDKRDSLGRRLRRRLAQVLVRTVMFEEFKALVDSLRTMDTDLAKLKRDWSQATATLYASQGALLLAPREVFVVGRKPGGV